MKNRGSLLSIAGVALVLAIGIPVAYNIIKPEPTLPIYAPSMVNPSLVDESVQHKSHSHRIADFELINQTGSIITPADYEGKIYVADFFFATCQSICPKMSGQMERMNVAFAGDPEIMFLSHSVMPEADSVPVLAEYAERYGANPDKWNLVTGDKKQIYDLARKSYFAVTTEGDGGEGDFIHTENFVLVDKDKRIRGFYDGTLQEDVDKCIADIAILKAEYAAEAAKSKN